MDQATPKELIDRHAGGGLDRHGSPHSLLRRMMRSFIYFFSYHMVLTRQNIQKVRAAGFNLTVRPTVFHPKFFVSSQRFAEFIDGLDLKGKRVIDVGTGSGILALAAARSGAENVVAADINPNAALNASENARANGFGDRIVGVCSNLLAGLAPRPLFDVILSSPPKMRPGKRSGRSRLEGDPAYRDVAALFDQARERLKPDRRIYVMVSSDSDLDLFGKLIDKAGFRAKLAHEYSILIESFIIYELAAG